MRFWTVVSRTLRTILWIIMAVVLLVTGIILSLYSPWCQEMLRQRLLARLNNKPGVEVTLDTFRIKFPLNVSLTHALIVQNGDTVLGANRIDADVSLLPLFKGQINIPSLSLSQARFAMGNPDSLMQLDIKADTLDIKPGHVGLKPLSINLDHADIRGGVVSLISRPDTTPKTSTPPPPTDLKIIVGNLDLQRFVYKMSLIPTIDSLGTTVGAGRLSDGEIDLLKQTVKIKSFTGTRLAAAYIAPDSAQINAFPVVPADTTTVEPWTVTIDSIHFTNSTGLYTTRGLKPLPGLDFGYIQASNMDLLVTDFYNQETTLRLPITLSATERCGVTLDAKGTFAMDSTAMYFKDFAVTSEDTELYAEGMLGVGDMLTDPQLPFSLEAHGNMGIPDLRLMFPTLKPILMPISKTTPLDLNVDVKGSLSDLNIKELHFKLNHCVSLYARGRIANITDIKKVHGHFALNGNIINVNSIVKALGNSMPLEIPPMTLKGDVDMTRGDIRAELNATTLGGELALKGGFNGNAQSYDINLQTNQFPVNAFDKSLGIGKATCKLYAHGQGFDPFSPSTRIAATANIISVNYNGYDYKGIAFSASLDSCLANIKATCHNKDLDATLQAHGNLQGTNYTWTAKVDAPCINLYNMKLSETPAKVSCHAEGNATTSPSFGQISADLDIAQIDYETEMANYALSKIFVQFNTTDSLTQLSINNRDLNANLSAPYCLDSLSSHFGHVGEILAHQIKMKDIQPDSVQKALPRFSIQATASTNNLINDLLAPHRMGIHRLELEADNDTSIDIKGRVLGIVTQTIRIDTIGLRIKQDGNRLQLKGRMENRPGTFDGFAHVDLTCLVDSNKGALRISQSNINRETGFDLGAFATLTDTTVTASLFPLSPIIGYKRWSVNLDNFISYNFPLQHIDANLEMKNDKSAISISSLPVPPDSIGINDLAVKINDIHISDWIAINPFAPPISGDLSANLRVKWTNGKEVNGDGTVTFDDFTYNKQRVGSFVSNIDVSTSMSGNIRALGDLSIDGRKTMSISGALNDSTATSPLDLDFNIDRLPLAIVNPFMPPATASLRGYLTGSMCLSGELGKPLFNGDLAFDSAAVKVAMTGTEYVLSDVKIPVAANLISFNNFTISGASDDPLSINGTVDIKSLMVPRINLNLDAKNFMVVNNNRAPRGADLYGKAFMDLGATVKGSTKFLNINANVTILPGTNVTYIVTDAMETTGTQNYNDMVKFVNFSDSLQIAQADSISNSSMLMSIDAHLNIRNGTTITADLNTGARDKVQVQPSANLTYTQSPASDGRLTGRVTINEGYARYTIPVIGQEKYFNIDPGSYIAFNGDILNPTLNIHANDPIKSNVTENNNSRMVNFDVLVAITGTFEQMNVKFDLSTNDDLAVANELQTMSPDQRANQAMNLLLYNVYTAPGSNTSANIGANPLYSFLESQVNNWAANNIKGIDLSFGIDQYNQTTNGNTASTMNYSYQMSKSLFNDRFKIVVGGNYNTDATNDENIAENLISDISFVYYLNNARTMLVKVFRHTGYESILEGEITQTGVGFVYKRKINYLVQVLPRFMRPKKYRRIQ